MWSSLNRRGAYYVMHRALRNLAGDATTTSCQKFVISNSRLRKRKTLGGEICGTRSI
jgi:hypothetical protein